MHGRPRKLAVLLMALAVCTSTVSTGCQSLRIPAIDPSGRRLFLPPPNYTTLAGPSPATPRFGILPTPAWTSPPLPPPCPDSPPPPTFYPEPDCGAPQSVPVVVAPQVLQAPRQDRITLTPKTIHAPIGSEVVLVSGLCSANGYYLKRQPIEWTLNRPGVGQFVEVSAERDSWKWLWSTQPGKVSADLAIGRTAVLPHTITKGNADPSDDVRVVKGQTWVSVTSPTEGTSRVTAYAPEVENWSLRKQTATIYWIDAQWSLPAPAVVSAGQTHLFSTKLTRLDGVTPLEGYIVRYEVTGGPQASFAPAGESVVDVISDPQGNAAVEISQAPNQAGTTQIRVQIIRPQRSADEPSIVIGTGWTSLTWSAPALALSMNGPATAALDSTLSYQITVTNPGDQTARGVVVQDILPPGLSLISSDPAGAPMGDRFEWQLGDLSGLSSQTITLNCRATRRGDIQHCVSARGADGLSADDCVTTRILAPSLSVNMTGPQAAEVGEEVEFRIEVTNLTSEVLRNVALTDSFSPGFKHTGGGTSPIRRPLGDLPAGSTQQVALRFLVQSPGQLHHSLEATADNSEKAVATAVLTATEPPAPVVPVIPDRPELQVRLTGASQARVGQPSLFTIEVANTGNIPLTGLRVNYRYPDSLTPSRVDKNRPATDHLPGNLIWEINQLEAGQRFTWDVECIAQRGGVDAIARVDATSQQNASDSVELKTQIAAVAAPPAGVDPGPGGGAVPDIGAGPQNGNVKGELTLSIADQGDPIRVGQRVTYLIVLKNDRNATDRNVRLTVAFPTGLDFKTLRSPLQGTVRASDREIELPAIAEMRAGESITIRVEAEATQVGQFMVRATAKSMRSPNGVNDEEQTTVNAR